jgi:AcrR family transcriptional regulator
MSKLPRPLRSDGEITSRRILETAGPLFATLGYAETSSKAIAQKAGVSLPSINYHFGSRAGLYQAALADAHAKLVSLSALQSIDASSASPVDKLARLIDALVAAATKPQAWGARLLAREVLAPSSHLDVLWNKEVQPKSAIVLGILSEATGIRLGDPALVRCLLSVAAPCLLLVVAGPGVPGPMQTVRAMPKEELAAHLRTFALAGLAAISEQRASERQTEDARPGSSQGDSLVPLRAKRQRPEAALEPSIPVPRRRIRAAPRSGG